MRKQNGHTHLMRRALEEAIHGPADAATLVRQIPMLASALQSLGRGDDKVLAHITPGEARLLKKRGGRGSKHPVTGLPEYGPGGGGGVRGGPDGPDHEGGGGGPAGAVGGAGPGGAGGVRGGPDGRHEGGGGGVAGARGDVGGREPGALDFTDPNVRHAAFSKPQVGTEHFADVVNQSYGLGMANPTANSVVGTLSSAVLGGVLGPVASLGIPATQALAGAPMSGLAGQITDAFGYEGTPNTDVSLEGRAPGGYGSDPAGRDAPAGAGGPAASAPAAPQDSGSRYYHTDPLTGVVKPRPENVQADPLWWMG